MARERAYPVATAGVAMMVAHGSVQLRPWNGTWGDCKYRQVDWLTTRATAWISLPVPCIKTGRLGCESKESTWYRPDVPKGRCERLNTHPHPGGAEGEREKNSVFQFWDGGVLSFR